jgi:NADH dehydrogenase FAD-containing subunit
MPSKVVVVGGGFCGTLVAKTLERDDELEVTLVDGTGHFEYTPEVHMLPFKPEESDEMKISFEEILTRSRIVKGRAREITPDHVRTEGETFPYDYLVVSTGADYPVMIPEGPDVTTLTSIEDAKLVSKRIPDSDTLLVVGGGLIGTEFCAELATKTEGKRIVLVHSKSRLIERNPKRASAYARRFLESRGVDIVLGQKIVGRRGNTYLTEAGSEISADFCIWSAGLSWNPDFMRGFPDQVFSNRGQLRVNPHLQLVGYPNIFVGGDIADIDEEKTAANAEGHACPIARNIRRLRTGDRLVSYRLIRMPIAISLGDWFGILTWGRLAITGPLPRLVKHGVLHWTMFRYRNL